MLKILEYYGFSEHELLRKFEKIWNKRDIGRINLPNEVEKIINKKKNKD